MHTFQTLSLQSLVQMELDLVKMLSNSVMELFHGGNIP
jgi:hypothetical protein